MSPDNLSAMSPAVHVKTRVIPLTTSVDSDRDHPDEAQLRCVHGDLQSASEGHRSSEGVAEEWACHANCKNVRDGIIGNEFAQGKSGQRRSRKKAEDKHTASQRVDVGRNPSRPRKQGNRPHEKAVERVLSE